MIKKTAQDRFINQLVDIAADIVIEWNAVIKEAKQNNIDSQKRVMGFNELVDEMAQFLRSYDLLGKVSNDNTQN
jgi:hypothetical protein